MVFSRPAGPCLCGHSSSSSRCRLQWHGVSLPEAAFLKGQLHQHFRRDIPASGNANFEFHYSSFRAMVFPRPAGPCLCGTAAAAVEIAAVAAAAANFLQKECCRKNSSSSNSNNNNKSNKEKKHEYVQVDIFLLPCLETFHLTCHSAWGQVRPFGFLCLLRILPDSLVVWIQVPHVGHAWT